MFTWQLANPASFWWWSWVADLGEYTVPGYPPFPLWLPDEADEIDYVIGVPNPSGDINGFMDGSYDTGNGHFNNYSASYSYRTGPTGMGSDLHSNHYGNSVLDPPPVVPHLFIQYYALGYPTGGGAKPPQPPLAYVPSTLVAGGYGPTMGDGSWSDWQPSYDYADTAFPVNFFVSGQVAEIVFFTPPGGVPVLQSQFDELAAGLGIWVSYSLQFASSFMRIETGGSSDSQASETYVGANFDATAIEGSKPTVLPTIIPSEAGEIPPEKVNPATSGLVQYETASTTWLEWHNSAITNVAMRVSTDDGAGNPAFGPADPGPVGFTPPTDAPWDVGVVDYVTPSGTPDVSHGLPFYQAPNLTPADVTLPLTRFTLTTVTTGMTSSPYTNDTIVSSVTLLPSSTVNLPTSDVVQKTFGLIVRTGYINGVSVPFDGPFSPGVDRGGNILLLLSRYPGDDTSNPYAFFEGMQLPGTFHSPRWRYWKPGTIVFHCPPGYDSKTTVTEGYWSPWIEGDLVTTYSSYRIHPQGQWDQNQMSTEYSTDGTFGAPPPPGGTLPVAWADLAAYLDGELAGARAGTLTRFDGEDNAGTDISLFKRWFYSGSSVTYQEWVASFRMYQDVATYDASHLLEGYGSDYYTYFADHGITNYGANPVTGLITDQPESTSTVLGWDNWVSTLTTVGDAPSWQDFQTTEGTGPPAPPSSSTPVTMPFLIRASSTPLSAWTNSFSLDPSLHFLGASDGALLTTVTLPTGSSSITIPLSDLGPVSGFTIFFRPQLLESGSIPFGDPTLPSYGYTWQRRSRIRGYVQNLSDYTYDNIEPSTRGNVPIIRIRRPLWRYWIPTVTTHECIPTTLRFNQRDDGNGVFGHPRLGKSTAAGANASYRVGGSNTYI